MADRQIQWAGAAFTSDSLKLTGNFSCDLAIYEGSFISGKQPSAFTEHRERKVETLLKETYDAPGNLGGH